MKKIASICIVLIFSLVVFGQSQSNLENPVNIVIRGGGIFPGNPEFKKAFNSTSSVRYGGGLEIYLFSQKHSYLTLEYLNLSAEGKVIENSQEKYKWNHKQFSIGLINKYRMKNNFILESGCGLSLINIKQKNKDELIKDTNFGVYGEFGVENKLAGDINWNLVSGYLFAKTTKESILGETGGFYIKIGLLLSLSKAK